MNKKTEDFSLIKKPEAFLPLGMSLAALILVIAHAAIYGIIHEADEGTAAHIFQFLMAAQLPIAAFFTIKWLPLQPEKTLTILALLAGLWAAAFAGVYWLT